MSTTPVLIMVKFFALCAVAVAGIAQVAEADTVEEMIKTRWNQNGETSSFFGTTNLTNTYNELAPPVSGETKGVMGCIAVAFGQVLKYYNYPKRGLPVKSYCNVDAARSWCPPDQIISDGENVEYDWDDMPNKLDFSSETDQILSVAQLLLNIAASVKARFVEGGTNAQTDNPRVFRGFRKAFRMANIKQTSRDEYVAKHSEADYEKMIKDEIRAQRPVILTGEDENLGAGHAIILDGLNEDGQVHVNMGWGGAVNGWYDFDKLEFTRQKYRFDKGQFAYTNLTPYTQKEGAQCNGPEGLRCEPDLVCTANGDLEQPLDETASDEKGICTATSESSKDSELPVTTEEEKPKVPEPTAEVVPQPKELKRISEQFTASGTGEMMSFGPFQSEGTVKIRVLGDFSNQLYVKLGGNPSKESYDCNQPNGRRWCTYTTTGGKGIHVAVAARQGGNIILQINTEKFE